MPFKRKEDPFKDIEAKYKDIEKKANEEIGDIEKLGDADERLKRYQALGQTLHGFNNGGKPKKPRGRKETREEYGSMSNARILYKLEQAVYRKIAQEQEIIKKEAETIRSLKRAAQLQQQFKTDFRRELHAKDTTGDIFKEVKAEIREDIQEIKKIDDSAERLKRYQALDKTLDGFYDGIKPAVTDPASAAGGAVVGCVVGLCAAFAVGAITLPMATAPVVLAILGGGVVSGMTGGAGLSGLLGGGKERKTLRAKYGSIRNARAMYRLDKTVEKKAEKEAKPLRARARAAKLQQQVDEAFRKKTNAPVVIAPAAPTKPARLIP